MTGGTGFIGSHVVEQLIALGASNGFDRMSDGIVKILIILKDKIILLPGNLFQIEQDAQQACENQQVVMNLAESVGGIETTARIRATMLLITRNCSVMIEAARCTKR